MRVWKYEIPRDDGGTWVELPKGAEFRHAAVVQPPFVNLWFEVDSNEPTEQRLFYVVATGQIIPDEGGYKHLMTILEGEFVWHIYERTEL